MTQVSRWKQHARLKYRYVHIISYFVLLTHLSRWSLAPKDIFTHIYIQIISNYVQIISNNVEITLSCFDQRLTRVKSTKLLIINAASIILVLTKVLLRQTRDKTRLLSRQRYASRDKSFVTTNICYDYIVILSRPLS